MARKTAPAASTDPESPYDSPAPAMVVSSPYGDDVPLVDQAPLVADAVERERMLAEVAAPAQFEVIQGGVFTVRGLRTMLRPGKVVDSRNFDVDSLRAQGAQLREVG